MNSDNILIHEIGFYNRFIEQFVNFRVFLPGHKGTLCEILAIDMQYPDFIVRLVNGGLERVNYRYPVILVAIEE